MSFFSSCQTTLQYVSFKMKNFKFLFMFQKVLIHKIFDEHIILRKCSKYFPKTKVFQMTKHEHELKLKLNFHFVLFSLCMPFKFMYWMNQWKTFAANYGKGKKFLQFINVEIGNNTIPFDLSFLFLCLCCIMYNNKKV